MTPETTQLNDHNKQEYTPMHKGEFEVSQIADITLNHSIKI
jgi:hypothetical protein